MLTGASAFESHWRLKGLRISDLFLNLLLDSELKNRAEGELGEANPQSEIAKCGSSSVVEHQLPKLRVAGSTPVSRSTKRLLQNSLFLFQNLVQ
jgi:hypothetical protein